MNRSRREFLKALPVAIASAPLAVETAISASVPPPTRPLPSVETVRLLVARYGGGIDVLSDPKFAKQYQKVFDEYYRSIWVG